MAYLNFGELDVGSVSPIELFNYYTEGYVTTRIGRGCLKKIRSLRVNLKKFHPSSENRRISRKYDHNLMLVPIPYKNYSWRTHKMGKDFYDKKFGVNSFTANKIKELFTTHNSDFNAVLEFKLTDTTSADGFCICLNDNVNIHYSYPFYSLELINSSFGMYMMTKTIIWAKENNYDYIYLGSVHDEKALYKLQFEGLEWYNPETKQWSDKVQDLKILIKNK